MSSTEPEALQDDASPAEREDTHVPFAVEDWLTITVMGLVACITLANVALHYFTQGASAWTDDFSVFLMVVLAMMAASVAVAHDRDMRSESLPVTRRTR